MAKDWKIFLKFKKASAIRQIVSEIWNKKEKIIREIREYKMKKLFINCQKPIEEIEVVLNEKYELKTKMFCNKEVIFNKNDF